MPWYPGAGAAVVYCCPWYTSLSVPFCYLICAIKLRRNVNTQDQPALLKYYRSPTFPPCIPGTTRTLTQQNWTRAWPTILSRHRWTHFWWYFCRIATSRTNLSWCIYDLRPPHVHQHASTSTKPSIRPGAGSLLIYSSAATSSRSTP